MTREATATRGLEPAPPGARDRRREATRETVLDAAIELFADHGCEGTTMRDIAERSGVKPPLIVYHFESKENLWKAAVDEVWRRMESTLEARMAELGVDAASAPTAAASRDGMRVVLRSFLHALSEHPEYLRILLREGSHRGPRFDWLRENHTRRNYLAGLDLFRRAQARGVFPDVPAEHLLFILVGALTFFLAIEADVAAHTGRDPRSDAFLDAHVDALVQLLMPASRAREED